VIKIFIYHTDGPTYIIHPFPVDGSTGKRNCQKM